MKLWIVETFGIVGKSGTRVRNCDTFGNFGIEFRRGDRHPSVDRSCLIKGHGFSTGGLPILMCIHIYIYIHTHVRVGRSPN